MAINDDIETFGSYVSGSRLLDRVTQAEQAKAGQYQDPLMSAWGSAGQAVAGAVNSAFGLVTPKTRAMESIARRNELARTMEANKIMPGTPESAQLGELFFQDMPQELEAFRQAQFNAAKQLDFAKYGEQLTTTQRMSTVKEINKSLTDSEAGKMYRTSLEKLKLLKAAVTDKDTANSGITDVQIVRLFLQIVEPNSAVTNDEAQMFGEAQGILFQRLGPEGLIRLNPNGYATGKFLSEASRKHLVQQANVIVQEKNKNLIDSARNQVAQYQNIIRPETLQKIASGVFDKDGNVKQIPAFTPFEYAIDEKQAEEEQAAQKARFTNGLSAIAQMGGKAVSGPADMLARIAAMASYEMPKIAGDSPDVALGISTLIDYEGKSLYRAAVEMAPNQTYDVDQEAELIYKAIDTLIQRKERLGEHSGMPADSDSRIASFFQDGQSPQISMINMLLLRLRTRAMALERGVGG